MKYFKLRWYTLYSESAIEENKNVPSISNPDGSPMILQVSFDGGNTWEAVREGW